MRRRSLLVTLFAGVALAAPAASAAATDAAGLADDCNKDGSVEIAGRMTVEGGAGVLNRDCFVTMSAKATLVMRNVTLTGSDVVFSIGDALASTTVVVDDTSISLGDGGAIQLSPGCCGGEEPPDRSERYAKITVTDSFLRAGTVELSASTAAPDGTVVIKRSVLKGVATWSENPVVVNASFSDARGKVSVSDSELISATGILIATGTDGTTRASRNTFAFETAVTLTTGAGGSCTSTANSPPTVCS